MSASFAIVTPRPRLEVLARAPGPVYAEQKLHFAADEEVYAEGGAAQYMYRLVSGLVRVCGFGAEGRRYIDRFYRPGEVFGLEAGAAHEFSAEAVTACVVVPWRRRVLEAEALRDAETGRMLLATASNAMARAQAHARLLARASAPQKMAHFLLELTPPGGGELELAMARQDIADYLGMTIETVSRTLCLLEREGVIAMPAARRIMLVGRAALEALAG
ncbi:helix-turn-helix domain-containing protein [Acidocella sp.]|uniref:helix-turn-helix domain-containing protein n=1 Tax=Acidocella sp. TaxID=50710 RepID=UPI00260C01F5|nr:helix-turn-helix domain-containing protein [Acidocella sp.]